MSGVSGLGPEWQDVTIGIGVDPCGFTGAWGRSCTCMVCIAGVGPGWSHNMTHALVLGTQACPRGDIPGLVLTDEDVGLFRG